ncbi:hypothetical protein DCC81_21840 [Chitinophaga parva]|uniref:FecR protein domain-containing protein n=1 Tax=Chitinophaga parva TaxID=2169414 RepID=A0A2T7BD76_9BACT|nr:FecR domain-containing protein [Chitinophaga parva]PUZ23049.1 hypothetical protein DCC81_21840 [Chitinophaga parva]
MEVRKIRQLLQRYLLGRHTPAEGHAVEQWYQHFDAEAPVQLTAEEEARISEEMWQHIRPALVPAKSILIAFHRRRWVRTTAAAAMVSGLALGAWWYRQAGPSSTLAYHEVHTRNGEQRTLQLPDSSRMTLNAGSTVRIADDFRAHRHIEVVDGEAFFDVKTNASAPFTVQSGDLHTTVLGTSFNVNAYTALHTMEISVRSGRVKVEGAGGGTVLTQGKALLLDKTAHTLRVQAMEPDALAWQHGSLVLNDASFADMAVLMEKNFGVRITATSATVKATRYTTELDLHMDPAQAVAVLAAIHHLKISGIGNQVLLHE